MGGYGGWGDRIELHVTMTKKDQSSQEQPGGTSHSDGNKGEGLTARDDAPFPPSVVRQRTLVLGVILQ